MVKFDDAEVKRLFAVVQLWRRPTPFVYQAAKNSSLLKTTDIKGRPVPGSVGRAGVPYTEALSSLQRPQVRLHLDYTSLMEYVHELCVITKTEITKAV